MRERDVESYLKRALWKIGVDCLKFVPEQAPGMPDRMVLLDDGRVLWVELKTDGGRLSEIQKYRHAWLTKLGHDVRVVWNKQQADELAAEIEKERRHWDGLPERSIT